MAQTTRVQRPSDFLMEAEGAAPVELSTLQAALKAAEAAVVKATAKREELSAVRYALNHSVAKMNAELVNLRREAFEATAMDKPANAKPLFAKIHALESDRNDALNCLSYVTSFSLNDAEIALVDANATERESTAKVLARQALDARKASLAAAEAAKQQDPGISINFGNANSQRLLEQSRAAQREADALRESLVKMRTDAQNEKQLVAGGLFNS